MAATGGPLKVSFSTCAFILQWAISSFCLASVRYCCLPLPVAARHHPAVVSDHRLRQPSPAVVSGHRLRPSSLASVSGRHLRPPSPTVVSATCATDAPTPSPTSTASAIFFSILKGLQGQSVVNTKKFQH